MPHCVVSCVPDPSVVILCSDFFEQFKDKIKLNGQLIVPVYTKMDKL